MTDSEKPCILAVDDSRVMRRAMTKVLGKEYEVVEAEHGEDAWTYLLNTPQVQVVFTDLDMPYLDGFGLLERMRTSGEAHLQQMPVIIITGKEDDDETKKRALDNGASDFITKPFDSVQLLARAKAHVHFEQTSRKFNETSDRLQQQAAVDQLTSLGGQHYFLKAAEETIAYVKRHAGQLVLMRLDIDDFNQMFINCGKEVANDVIAEVGKTLGHVLRKEDMVARVGLAKFAMLMRDISTDDANDTAKRMLQDIAQLEFQNGDAPFHVTASVGILEPQVSDHSNIADLIRDTEQYLEKACTAGGNQIAVKSLRKISTGEEISVQTALRFLSFGHQDNIKPHIPELLQQLLPLLEYMVSNMEGEQQASLAALTAKLKS